MSQRNQFNIGESVKTSVKVQNNPGGQSNWSLGWQNESNNTNQPKNVKYHNQSNIVFEDKKLEAEEEQRKKKEEKLKKQEELNNKVPQYDPKNGGKSTFSFGSDPTDYRKKDEVFTSVKVKNPPGGRSNIQFG